MFRQKLINSIPKTTHFPTNLNSHISIFHHKNCPINLMQLLCEFQHVQPQYKYDLGVLDILFHNIHKPNTDLKKQGITKLPNNF